VLDRPIPLIVLAAIVAAVLGVAAGCGGDQEGTAEEARTTETVTTAPVEDPAQRRADDGDRPCPDAAADIEREADRNTACREVGQSPDQQVAPPATAGATSEENAEIVHRFYDAWNRRDFDDAVRLVHEDFEFQFIGGFAKLIGEEFHGRDGLLRLMRGFVGTAVGQVAVERTFDMGERVGVIASRKASEAKSGDLGSLRFRQVWTFRDAKVIRVQSSFAPRVPLKFPREAIEAPGLRE
jgi:ketosteroid isomerase-like protein